MLDFLLNILFPENCAVCGKKAADRYIAPICRACWETITPYHGPACRKCGRPLTSEVSASCGECIAEEPAFDTARSFGLYEGALKKAIGLMKYHGIRRLSAPLSDILALIDLPPADAVIPVPLHEKRLRQREFNQSALLAKKISDRSRIPLLVNCLVRTRDTAQQVGLRLGKRKKNLRNAFNVGKTDHIAARDIILVDDVFTTGTTVRECSRVLKAAGARSIYVITLAHGIMD